VKVQPLNPPDPLAVQALADPIVPLPLIVNEIVAPGEKPLPEAVTVAPLGPWTGESDSPGAVTVNIAVAVSPDPPTTFPTAVVV
jgi:hypothetical protein